VGISEVGDDEAGPPCAGIAPDGPAAAIALVGPEEPGPEEPGAAPGVAAAAPVPEAEGAGPVARASISFVADEDAGAASGAGSEGAGWSELEAATVSVGTTGSVAALDAPGAADSSWPVALVGAAEVAAGVEAWESASGVLPPPQPVTTQHTPANPTGANHEVQGFIALHSFQRKGWVGRDDRRPCRGGEG
jgi:hypothetical protein